MRMSPFVRNVLETSRSGNSSNDRGSARPGNNNLERPVSPPRLSRRSNNERTADQSMVNDDNDSVSEKSSEMAAAQAMLEQRMKDLEERAGRLNAREDALRQFASSGEYPDRSSSSGNPFDYGDDPLTPIRPRHDASHSRSSNFLRGSYPPSAGNGRRTNQEMYSQMPAVAEATQVAIAADMARTEAEIRGVKAEQ